MSPEPDQLRQLHDIHMPTALDPWSIAPGWYALAGLLLVMMIAILIAVVCWYRRGKVKREAMSMLAQYEKTYTPKTDTQTMTAALNELLKRVALVYFPREQVASLCGQEWVDFLQETSQNLDFLAQGEALLYGPYQPNQARDLRPLFHLVRGWIAQRERPCLS